MKELILKTKHIIKIYCAVSGDGLTFTTLLKEGNCEHRSDDSNVS